MMMDGENTYFDVEMLARYLMMSKNTIRQYVSRGKIPFIKVPGSNLVRFSKVAVDEWMMGGLQGAGIVAEATTAYRGDAHGTTKRKKRQG